MHRGYTRHEQRLQKVLSSMAQAPRRPLGQPVLASPAAGRGSWGRGKRRGRGPGRKWEWPASAQLSPGGGGGARPSSLSCAPGTSTSRLPARRQGGGGEARARGSVCTRDTRAIQDCGDLQTVSHTHTSYGKLVTVTAPRDVSVAENLLWTISFLSPLPPKKPSPSNCEHLQGQRAFACTPMRHDHTCAHGAACYECVCTWGLGVACPRPNEHACHSTTPEVEAGGSPVQG